MKTFIVLIAFVLMLIPIWGQEKSTTTVLKYVGRIDTYPIELEWQSYDYTTGEIKGRYKYIKQNKYIEIKGTVSYPCIHVEETYKGKVTGNFYLEMDNLALIGYWTSETKTRKVEMNLTQGNLKTWQFNTLEDYATTTNSKIEGSYGVESFWVNDFFADQDNPAVEIGFNGGYAVFNKIGEDTLQFQLEVICGPTYHFAYSAGFAIKKGDLYYYTSSSEASDEMEPCQITFKFSDKSVYAEANSTMECEFGARAYLGHSFTKVSDAIKFGEEVSLSSIKGK
jgi:hypothetical protein